MNRRDKNPTLAPTAIDAIVVALSPALIIGMVSCLVFFLVVAFYRGEYDQRLMYILGLFTLATVLIARIAIESGRTYANAFSLPLAIVSVIAMFRFVTIAGPLGPISPLINIVLLGVAWYLADRITFDCTSVDERDSGVQQGLLQSLGLLKKETLPKPQVESRDAVPQAKEATENSVAASQQKSTAAVQAKKKKKKRHNPGVWVLYFALLALPLFGLGQLTIPDEASRSTAFYFLVGYLGCALALLSTTSFISTRRYLRHRGASMPAEMSRSWLGYAGAGIVALLLICLLLPLPGRSLGLVGLPFELKSPDGLQTSRWGWGKEGVQPSESEVESGAASDGGIVRADAKDKGNAAGAPQPDGKGEPQASDRAKQDASNASGDGGKSENSKSENGKSEGNQSQGNPSDSKSSDQAAEKKNSGAGDSQKSDSQKSDSQKSDSQKSDSQKSDAQKSDASSEQQSSDKQSGDKQPGDQQSGNDDEAPGEQPENRQERDDAENVDASEQAAEEAESQAGEDSKQDQAASKAPPPTSSPSSNGFNWLPSGLADIIKWLTIAVLALIVILYAITHPREVLQLWRDFLDFIARLFGGRSSRDTAAAVSARQSAAAATAELRPFRSFANPFANQLQGWTPEQAIHQTFAALEAWAAEQGRRRQRDETAAEFAKHLGRRIPSVDPHAATAARMLDSLMFAGWKPTSQEIAPLAKVWQALVEHAKDPAFPRSGSC